MYEYIHSFHWHVQNAAIPCRSHELLPFLSVTYIFLLPFSTNCSSILPHFILLSISWSTLCDTEHKYKLCSDLYGVQNHTFLQPYQQPEVVNVLIHEEVEMYNVVSNFLWRHYSVLTKVCNLSSLSQCVLFFFSVHEQSQYSLVSIVTRLCCGCLMSCGSIPDKARRFFLFSKTSRQAPRPTQPLLCVLWALSCRVKQHSSQAMNLITYLLKCQDQESTQL